MFTCTGSAVSLEQLSYYLWLQLKTPTTNLIVCKIAPKYIFPVLEGFIQTDLALLCSGLFLEITACSLGRCLKGLCSLGLD